MEENKDSNSSILVPYLPPPYVANEEISMVLTGGRGIYTGSSCDRGSFLICGASEEDKLQRALLKMDVRHGEKPKSDLTKFDQKVELMIDSLP